VRNPSAVSPRFPGGGSSARGESEPKPRPKGVGDGKQVNIPVPPHGEEAGGTEKVNAAGCWTSRFKAVGRPGGKRNFRARPRADDVGFGPQVRDTMLPRKAPRSVEPCGDRTANRHRWARRESSGA